MANLRDEENIQQEAPQDAKKRSHPDVDSLTNIFNLDLEHAHREDLPDVEEMMRCPKQFLNCDVNVRLRNIVRDARVNTTNERKRTRKPQSSFDVAGSVEFVDFVAPGPRGLTNRKLHNFFVGLALTEEACGRPDANQEERHTLQQYQRELSAMLQPTAM